MPPARSQAPSSVPFDLSATFKLKGPWKPELHVRLSTHNIGRSGPRVGGASDSACASIARAPRRPPARRRRRPGGTQPGLQGCEDAEAALGLRLGRGPGPPIPTDAPGHALAGPELSPAP